MFAKYDVDGDRVLDEAEQRKMHADLEGQRVRKVYNSVGYQTHICGDPGTQRSVCTNDHLLLSATLSHWNI